MGPGPRRKVVDCAPRIKIGGLLSGCGLCWLRGAETAEGGFGEVEGLVGIELSASIQFPRLNDRRTRSSRG
mgnify:CR=1 FL=1